MPKNTLRGTEPISKIHPYLYLYADVRQMENLYDKFVRFLDCRIESSKSTDKNKLHQDNIRIDDIIGDILNPQTGANATVNKVYNLTFGSENMAKDVLEVGTFFTFILCVKLYYFVAIDEALPLPTT